MITRPYAEHTLAAVFLRTRFNTQEPYRLTRVEFSHPAPASISEHERIFGCPVRFGGGDPRLDAIAKRLAMSPRTLQRRLSEHGAVFNDVLDRFCACSKAMVTSASSRPTLTWNNC